MARGRNSERSFSSRQKVQIEIYIGEKAFQKLQLLIGELHCKELPRAKEAERSKMRRECRTSQRGRVGLHLVYVYRFDCRQVDRGFRMRIPHEITQGLLSDNQFIKGGPVFMGNEAECKFIGTSSVQINHLGVKSYLSIALQRLFNLM